MARKPESLIRCAIALTVAIAVIAAAPLVAMTHGPLTFELAAFAHSDHVHDVGSNHAHATTVDETDHHSPGHAHRHDTTDHSHDGGALIAAPETPGPETPESRWTRLSDRLVPSPIDRLDRPPRNRTRT